MSFDYEKVIPAPIPMKRMAPPKMKFNDMNPVYTSRLQDEAKKTSQLFREKVAQDLARAMKGKT